MCNTLKCFCVSALVSGLKEMSLRRMHGPQWICSGQPRRVGDRWEKDTVLRSPCDDREGSKEKQPRNVVSLTWATEWWVRIWGAPNEGAPLRIPGSHIHLGPLNKVQLSLGISLFIYSHVLSGTAISKDMPYQTAETKWILRCQSSQNEPTLCKRSLGFRWKQAALPDDLRF